MSSHFTEDNYLPKESYSGYATDHEGFSRFMHKDQYYFAYSSHGDVILRSEGYSQEAGRENGIASVRRYKDDDANYRTQMQPDGQWVLGLYASNNKEIARSGRFDSEAESRAMLPSALITRYVKSVELGRIDDYLTCKEYDNHRHNSDHPEFSLFEKEGQYYFGYHQGGEHVLLRSEGYKTVESRLNGMQSVMRNKGERERYHIEEKFGHYFVILTANNAQEIARSCPLTDAGAFALIGLLVGGPVVATAIAPPPVVTPVVATPIVTPVAAPIATAISAPIASAIAAPIAVAPVVAGSRWWLWLLPLLLLALLFFLWKGCNNGEMQAIAPVATPADTSTVAAKPEPIAEPKAEPVPAKATACGWQPVLFGYGESKVADTERADVQKVVDALNTNTSYTLKLVGFTDDKGNVDFNARLAQRRADAVKQVATDLGVDASRITTEQLNESQPAATNTSEAGRQYNRRVVMYVYDAKGKLVCENVEDTIPASLKPE